MLAVWYEKVERPAPVAVLLWDQWCRFFKGLKWSRKQNKFLFWSIKEVFYRFYFWLTPVSTNLFIDKTMGKPRDIYSIRRYCWNVATYKWKVHNWKIDIISFVVLKWLYKFTKIYGIYAKKLKWKHKTSLISNKLLWVI